VRRALGVGHGDQAGGDQGALTVVPVGEVNLAGAFVIWCAEGSY